MIAGFQRRPQNRVALPGLLSPPVEVSMKDFLGLADHLARDGWLIIDAFFQI